MMRRIALFVAVITATTGPFALSELPTSDGEESFEVEPPVLIPNREIDEPVAATTITAGRAGDPERLERELERATRNAEGAERLFKMGVLAKAEVEQRALRVVRVQANLEAARLARIQEEMRLQEARVATSEISKADLAKTERLLAEAVQAADAAADKRERAELEAAETNLRRQKKLMALGSGRKSEVNRAQERLAELKAPKN
jgi:hypothetical protein